MAYIQRRVLGAAQAAAVRHEERRLRDRIAALDEAMKRPLFPLAVEMLLAERERLAAQSVRNPEEDNP